MVLIGDLPPFFPLSFTLYFFYCILLYNNILRKGNKNLMLFKDKYFFLSNFYPCAVTLLIRDKILSFKNSEAAYQAQKNEALAENFILLKGLEAKKLGENLKITTSDWDTYRLYAMARALNSKFKNPVLMSQLKQIKENIVEDNYWNDTYWGVCKGVGDNILGKMLMIIRDNENDLNILNNFIKNELLP